MGQIGQKVNSDGVVRGEIWWADIPEPRASESGFSRPVLIIQAAAFHRSRLRTVIVASITTNVAIADAPGTVFLPTFSSGLAKDSVVNVSQIFSLDRMFLRERAGSASWRLMATVNDGLRLILAL